MCLQTTALGPCRFADSNNQSDTRQEYVPPDIRNHHQQLDQSEGTAFHNASGAPQGACKISMPLICGFSMLDAPMPQTLCSRNLAQRRSRARPGQSLWPHSARKDFPSLVRRQWMNEYKEEFAQIYAH